MPKIQKYQSPTSNGIQYTPLTPAQAYANKATNYFDKTIASSLLSPKKNTLFKDGILNLGALSNTTGLSLTKPSMNESVSAALTADPVSSAVKESGSGFLSKLGGLKGMGMEIAGSAPELIDAGLGALGVKKADENLARGAAMFDKGAGVAFKAAMKTGNPLAIAATGVVAGLSKINMYGGKTLKSAGTDAINMKGYTAGVETAGKFAITGGGKKFDRFAKQNKNIANTNLLKGNASYQDSKNQLAASNSYGDIATKNAQQLQGGINPNILSVKKGGTINPKKFSNITKKVKHKMTKAQEGSNLDDLQKFALGGNVNVIPEGALHAHKNHFEEDIAKQVTSKGIPVITYEEGNKIVQHAEIERNEVIFHLDTTRKFEKMFDTYNECEDSKQKILLEIECGKLLTEELLENTIDNTGLLEEVN